MMSPATRWLCGASALLTAALLALAGSAPAAQDAGRGAPSGLSGNDLLVAYTTELNGYLTPCGCSHPMMGGIPRRATWLHSLARSDALVKVDNGDLTQALGRQDEIKAETLVEMMNALGLSAVNMGEKDFRLGVPYLQSLQARFKGALLCANVVRQDDAPLLAEQTTVTRKVRGQDVKIAIAGVISSQHDQIITALNPDLKVQPVEEALKRVEPQMTAAELRVLLYHGTRAEAEQVAAQFPYYQLIVCAHEGDPSMKPVKVGETTIVCSGQDGKYGERARIEVGSWKVADVKSIPLGPEFADDPGISAIKQTYVERIVSEDLLAKVPKIALPAGDRFVGSASCAPCHKEDYDIWKKSGHSHALETLVKVKHDRDPECVQCHVVGLDKISGFVNAVQSAKLADVGCESCHGPGAKHSADPKVKMGKLGPDSCVGCHNPENSPGFDFKIYWPKIKH